MSIGRSIRLYLINGTPTGMIAAEIMNWTGHVLTAPRTKLADLVKRKELDRTGIYFLSGTASDEDTRQTIYVGETDNVGNRLVQHNRPEERGGKDFWDRVTVVTSKDRNLTKGHVKYLESQMIVAANEAGRARLANASSPSYHDLPEPDRDDMDYFAEQIKIVLPVLGQDFLRPRPRVSKRADSPQESETSANKKNLGEEVIFEILSKQHGLNARAVEVDGEFIVLSGSIARGKWVGDLKHAANYQNLYNELIVEGKLSQKDEHLVFTEDVAFSAPSAAAAIVYGRTANGRKRWKVCGTNETYADYSERQVDAAAGGLNED